MGNLGEDRWGERVQGEMRQMGRVRVGAKGKSDREGGRERERKRERESSDMKADYLIEFGGKSHVFVIYSAGVFIKLAYN